MLTKKRQFKTDLVGVCLDVCGPNLPFFWPSVAGKLFATSCVTNLETVHKLPHDKGMGGFLDTAGAPPCASEF
jgi:hypothetical protein